ncbi:MAG: DJ-1/PfpI family protein [Deltaproteobacteria bacterium]|nr:DJ-1/PfpI family protein [Deltaproteobacteria bacterium]
MNVNFILFDNFETLDLFGPAEVLGRMPEYSLRFNSLSGGLIKSAQAAEIMTRPSDEIEEGGIVVIPGGQGTRQLADEAGFIGKLKTVAGKASWVLTVCTGSGLLAKTGLLDGMAATGNKIAFEWVKSTGREVRWQKRARWVADGKYYTSSGISAGIDMALGFISDRFGETRAKDLARVMEYSWSADKDSDPFAVL